MAARVLDVGNCAMDHGALRSLLAREFNAIVDQADSLDDAVRLASSQTYDLITVNRILDVTGDEGLELVRRTQGDPALQKVPIMMITNFGEHQELAVKAGAELGFGKRDLGSAEMLQRVAPFLKGR